MQGRWLIHTARYASIVLIVLAVWMMVLIDAKLSWLILVAVPLLLLAARFAWHRSVMRALHQGRGSLMAVLASAVTPAAAALMAFPFIHSMEWQGGFAIAGLGCLAAAASGYLFEVASFDSRYDED